jgi:hypothetical protein
MILDTEYDGNKNLKKAKLYTIQTYLPGPLKTWRI